VRTPVGSFSSRHDARGVDTRGDAVAASRPRSLTGCSSPRAALRSLEHAGYVYRGGDFDSLAKDWECPPCGSGKNRFKVYQEGNAYDQMAAQKKANKAALAAKKKGGPSKRELLKQKMLEEQAEMDKKKGGRFFGR
jgi:hypothetical protein